MTIEADRTERAQSIEQSNPDGSQIRRLASLQRSWRSSRSPSGQHLSSSWPATTTASLAPHRMVSFRSWTTSQRHSMSRTSS